MKKHVVNLTSGEGKVFSYAIIVRGEPTNSMKAGIYQRFTSDDALIKSR